MDRRAAPALILTTSPTRSSFGPVESDTRPKSRSRGPFRARSLLSSDCEVGDRVIYHDPTPLHGVFHAVVTRRVTLPSGTLRFELDLDDPRPGRSAVPVRDRPRDPPRHRALHALHHRHQRRRQPPRALLATAADSHALNRRARSSPARSRSAAAASVPLASAAVAGSADRSSRAHEALRRVRRGRRHRLRDRARRGVRLPRPERRGQELDDADDRLRLADLGRRRCACSASIPRADGAQIRGRLGVVPQEDNLDTELTVWDNLMIYGRYFDLPRAEIRRAGRGAARVRAARPTGATRASTRSRAG